MLQSVVKVQTRFLSNTLIVVGSEHRSAHWPPHRQRMVEKQKPKKSEEFAFARHKKSGQNGLGQLECTSTSIEPQPLRQ